MKKLVVFLVLLGIGLAILSWLEEDAKPTADPDEGPPRAKVPTTPLGIDQGVSLGGRFTGRVYDEDTNRAVLRVESVDSGTRGSEDIFVDVTLELLDPDSESAEAQAMLRSKRARIARTGARPEFEPRHEARVFLEDVEARFLQGLPIVPLTVSTEAATIDATDAENRTLSSDEPIEIRSDDLIGGGVGLLSNIDGEVTVIREQGWVEFRDEENTTVRFSSLERGPLQISREEGEDSRPVRIEAWEGARLELLGEEGSTLDATRILARGMESEIEGESFQIRVLEAEGNVVWVFGDNEFRGDRATIELDGQGELVRARLEGPPTSAKLALEGSSSSLPDVPAEDVGAILVYGNESIVITRDERTEFDIDGPATVEAQGFRLRSNGNIDGWLGLDRKSALFTAHGGVVLEGDRADLETAEFTLTLQQEDEAETLRGVARGGTRLTGILADGRNFNASTPEELEVLRIGDSLQVVRGQEVEMEVDDPNGFRARADEIFDVDFANLAFTAQGNVEITGSDGISRGDRLVAEGPGKFTLSGSPERRARFENAQGWAEADTVETDGNRLHARGNVEADLTTGVESESLEEAAYQRYRLRGEELILIRTGDAENPDEESQLRTFDLEMNGSVNAIVRAGPENTTLNCDHLEAKRRETFEGRGASRKLVSADTDLLATGQVDGHLSMELVELDLRCDQLEVTGREREGEEDFQQATATGNVTFVGTSRVDFRGRGELLVLDSNQNGRLEAPQAGRVELAGILPSLKAPFRMTAQEVEFEGENILAKKPDLRVGGNRAKADRLVTTPDLMKLEGAARLSGTTKNHQPWTLDADAIDLRGRASIENSEAELATIDARGNVTFRLGTLVEARGDLLARDRTGIMRLTGSLASIGTEVVEYEAEWIEFDPDLQIIRQTGRGRVRPGPEVRARNAAQEAGEPIKSFGPKPLPQDEEGDDGGWGLEFLSSSTLVEPDSLVYVLQEPVFNYVIDGVESTMRASWTVLWLDRQGWLDLPNRLGDGVKKVESSQAVAGPMGLFFHFIERNGIEGLVREVYFEGPVEVLSQEDVVAHADAIYLNVNEGHGWLANATVNILGKHLDQDFEQMTVKADWLRHSADGSLHADDATVTPCDFAEPHAEIVTGDLRITPLEGQSRFHLDVKKNRVELYNLPAIPLPPISFDTDENLRPFWPSISVGNSARFGSLFGLKFGGSSETVAKVAENAAGKDSKKEPREFDANYEIDAQYLGSRGGLLDIGMELKSKERYWFELWTGIVYDTGRDRGYVQVDEDDRDDLRLWMRGLNTVQLGKSRLTFTFNDQSDAGVQSEFWESEFVYYEQAETYLQWKRPSNNTYSEMTAKFRTDGFVSDVEELPSGSVFFGRAPILEVGGYSLLHTGETGASYLRRREGSDPVSPFALPATFSDGLGNREVLRVDTTQEIEMPIPLGFAGLKLVPFTTLQAAAWDEAVDEDESASRVVAQAGVRLGTTFWKQRADGAMHSISPYIKYSNEVASEFNEAPVVFSPLEAQVFGDFLEVGARSRFGITEGRSGLDLDLKGTYASDRSDGEDDGWLPIQVFGRLDVSPFGQLLEIWHDGRYDVEEGDTKFSLFAIGSRAGENLEDIGWQVSHHRGRDFQGLPLFEAASIAGFYRWTEKWEFEGRQSFSLLEDQDLGFRVIVRRYGHDMIFELETAFREGEGSSFGVNFSPRLGHTPSKVGYLNW